MYHAHFIVTGFVSVSYFLMLLNLSTAMTDCAVFITKNHIGAVFLLLISVVIVHCLTNNNNNNNNNNNIILSFYFIFLNCYMHCFSLV